MGQSVAKTEDRTFATVCGRVVYAVLGAVTLGLGYGSLPYARGWLHVFIAGTLFVNVFTYRPSRRDKVTEEAMGLAWAVILLCTAPPLLLVIMFCLDGGIGRDALPLWGTGVLASILGPGYVVWRYFRRRKS